MPLGDMKGLLERLLDEAEGQRPRENNAPPSSRAVDMPPPEGGGDVGGGSSPLTGLLTNPALLSALPVIMENLSPLMGSLSRGGGIGSGAVRPHGVDRHTALLCAIKPYLSPRRQEAADTVIRLCRVWDALEKSGVHIGDLLGSVGGTSHTSALKGESGGGDVQ